MLYANHTWYFPTNGWFKNELKGSFTSTTIDVFVQYFFDFVGLLDMSWQNSLCSAESRRCPIFSYQRNTKHLFSTIFKTAKEPQALFTDES